MKDFHVKDIGVFKNLSNEMKGLQKSVPELIQDAINNLEDFKNDLFNDLKETEDELDRIRQAQTDEIVGHEQSYGDNSNEGDENELSQKLENLKGSVSQITNLVSRFQLKARNFEQIMEMNPKAIKILEQFDYISHQYLSSNYSNSSQLSQSTPDHRQASDAVSIRSIGDTFHYSKDSNLSQMAIDSLEHQVNQSSVKGNKISIDKVSSSDFSLLEKNGYTIQQTAPNEYTAYKTIQK